MKNWTKQSLEDGDTTYTLFTVFLQLLCCFTLETVRFMELEVNRSQVCFLYSPEPLFGRRAAGRIPRLLEFVKRIGLVVYGLTISLGRDA